MRSIKLGDQSLRAKKENTIYKDNKWFVAFHGAELLGYNSVFIQYI